MTDQTITFRHKDQTFTIDAPYTEGHVLTAEEAAALNRLRAENIRNNVMRKIPEGATHDEIQTTVTKYAKTYKFGGTTSRTMDPVERLVRQQAWSLATSGRYDELLAEANIKLFGEGKTPKSEVIDFILSLETADGSTVGEALRKMAQDAFAV